MRWAVVLLAGLLGIAGAVFGLADARAGDGGVIDAAADPPTPSPPHRMAGWQRLAVEGLFAGQGQLVFTPADRQLSQSDVQKIAEAYLLWHGNRAWRVGKLSVDEDAVGFAITTANDAVIATFAMDRHTGAVARTG